MRQPETSFCYTAVSTTGNRSNGVVQARDQNHAFAKAARSGQTIIALEPLPDNTHNRRPATPRILQIALLRQLAVMTGARVDVTQALAAMHASTKSPALRTALDTAQVALRSGSPLGACLDMGIPGLPPSTLALINAGEAGGALQQTITHAVEQLETEERLGKAIKSALVYPAFLTIAGLAAAAIMLLFVIPRFAEIIGDQREKLTGMSWFVFWLGDLAQKSFGLVLVAPILLGFGIFSASKRRAKASYLMGILSRLPVINQLILARDRERWSRIMAFALFAKIGIVDAIGLAAAGLRDPDAKGHADAAVRELRLGARVADAVKFMGLLDDTQLSMVRVGEESGSIAEMFERIAIETETTLQEGLKRFTMAVEQAVILVVSMFVGLIVFGLISSLTSVYETIGQ